MKILINVFLIFLIIIPTYTKAELKGQNSGLKLPRFVSTKSDESNLRIGANINYPILLTYILENFPLEITNEYQQWREVKDINGNQGWMHKSLFQGDRYGIIKNNHSEPTQIFNKPKGDVIWKIGNRNIVKINKCFNLWCFISYNKFSGWINKKNIWGVYEEEEFNMPFYQFFINLYWEVIK